MAKNKYYNGPPSDHFDGLRFFFPGGPEDKTLGDLARMVWNMRRERKPWPREAPILPCAPPPSRVTGTALRVTFIGHSTFLIQTEGVNLLTDPIWSDCAGPYGRIGPRRVTPPGLALDQLPPLDAILLSHNHYDHLDLATLSRLSRLRPCPVLTPLGNDTILRRHDAGIDVRTFDWGDSVDVAGLRIIFEPAMHWSARSRGDRRMALWASFMIRGAGGAIYFAGDTGVGDGALFSQLAQRHGPVRLAMLPIGAYAPRWFMRDQHADPEEAVEIFRLLGAERAIACHWGAFRLTDEPFDEPPRRLAEALVHAGIDSARFNRPATGGCGRGCRPSGSGPRRSLDLRRSQGTEKRGELQ